MSAAALKPAPPAPATLERRLGPYDAAAIIVSNVIGNGIFFVPIIVAGLVPSAWSMLGVWILGGMLAFAGAMAYAELATLRPRAGGEYVYLRDAYGPVAAFLTGWTSFVAGFSGAIAAGAVLLADYIGRFIPIAADKTALLTIPLPYAPIVLTPNAIIAIATIVSLSLVHFHGSGRFVHNFLAGLKVSTLCVFIALGLALGTGSFGNLGGSHAVPQPATGWLQALIPIMFTYSGWNAAAYVAEEIKNPGRNVPLALGLGTLAIVAIYLALNVLYLYAMPIEQMAALLQGGGRLTDIVAERLFGFVAGNLLAIFTIISIAASISAMVLAGPRVYYAMARDGVFLQSASRVHAVHKTPVSAIVAQAIWSSILVLSGTLTQLVNYTGFAVVLFAGVAVSAVFVLRHREPNAERPFRTLGYPLAPAVFVIASLVMVVYQLVAGFDARDARIGLLIILAGLPLYYVISAFKAKK